MSGLLLPTVVPGPQNVGEIDLLEETLRSFTRKIKGMDCLDYVQCLKKLKIYSIQTRHERFKIIYLYNINEGLVPNISSTKGLIFSEHGRCGCMCDVPYFHPRGKAGRAR